MKASVLRMRTAQKGRGKFISVSIPEELINEVDHEIESGSGGYESRPEFIKESVRRRLEERRLYKKQMKALAKV